MPVLTVIAGPNGSGKSTFARAMKLPSIDPDRIAADYGEGFTDSANLRAAREALQLTAERLKRHESLIVETTLAGRQPLRLMAQAREAGYLVLLAFIVPNIQDDTRFRIDNRVLEGGHNIPDADLKRRAMASRTCWGTLTVRSVPEPSTAPSSVKSWLLVLET